MPQFLAGFALFPSLYCTAEILTYPGAYGRFVRVIGQNQPGHEASTEFAVVRADGYKVWMSRSELALCL